MANAFGAAGNIFGAKSSTQQDSKEFTEFVKQVSGEMTQWEGTGQWLISAFTPLKSHPPIPGFTDVSPEEVRLKAYDALKSSTSSAYQTYWNELQQRYKQLRDALKMSTPEAVQAMREIFHNKSSLEQKQQQTAKPSLFGKPPEQSVFGGSTATGSGPGLFGAKPQSSVFGATPAAFGGNQPASPSQGLFGGGTNKTVFGGQAAVGGFGGQQSPSVFALGSNPSSNVFKSGTPQTGGNPLFGGSTTSTAMGNAFAGTQNQGTVSSLFGRNNANQTSAFGGMDISSQNNMFAGSQSQTGGLFGASTTGTTGNAVSGQTNVFGNQKGVFSGQQSQQPSLFGKPATNVSSVFGGSQPASTTPQNAPPSNPAGSSGTGIFGGNSSGAVQGSVFGGSTESTTGGTGLFGGNTSASVTGGTGLLGNSPNSPSVFGKAMPSVFGGASPANPSPGLFGKAPDSQPNPEGGTGLLKTPEPGQLPTPMLFGKPVPGAANLRGCTVPSGNIIKKPEWYTPMDELQPGDKAQFEAERFTTIPLCPPPIELC